MAKYQAGPHCFVGILKEELCAKHVFSLNLYTACTRIIGFQARKTARTIFGCFYEAIHDEDRFFIV